MSSVKIITNNPMVLAAYPHATFCESSTQGILLMCRDAIHQGAVLVNHPLSGSIQPHILPYRSLALTIGKSGTHFKSLQYIEAALRVTPAADLMLSFSAEVLTDFQVIDLDLFNAAMMAAY